MHHKPLPIRSYDELAQQLLDDNSLFDMYAYSPELWVAENAKHRESKKVGFLPLIQNRLSPVLKDFLDKSDQNPDYLPSLIQSSIATPVKEVLLDSFKQMVLRGGGNLAIMVNCPEETVSITVVMDSQIYILCPLCEEAPKND